MKLSYFTTLFYHIRRFMAYAGPGYIIAVGYMDPGNWVTDIAGGSAYGYSLLSVILISNIMAMMLQYCALKLGIVTGKDLARACRDYYSPLVSRILWIFAECGVIATDLAEVIGSAIGLHLLCGIPLIAGVCITIADVLLLLFFMHKNIRSIQLLLAALMGVISICFAIIIALARPCWTDIIYGFIPTSAILHDSSMLYLAIGILGATVMPHNLYLHSSLVKSDPSAPDSTKQRAIFYSNIDSCIALTYAFFINAAILIVSGAVFYARGLYSVTEIQDAYYLFTPLLSTPVASFVFALALLIAGQNSTITGTLAGQIIMEGFIDIQIPAWLRRIIGRCLTIIPALVCILAFGESSLSWLMIVSQVILSLQLPFAVFPLIQFTNSSAIMGNLANGALLKIAVYCLAFFIVAVNTLLLYGLL